MKPDSDELPAVANTARHLGVRAEELTVSPDGMVMPGGGGMSVATGSFWNLPPHRRPKVLGNGSTGPAGDLCYRAAVPFDSAPDLRIREDLPDEHHAVVEPITPMTRAAYDQALAGTRSSWVRVAP
jgi:hypothetical protein